MNPISITLISILGSILYSFIAYKLCYFLRYKLIKARIKTEKKLPLTIFEAGIWHGFGGSYTSTNQNFYIDSSVHIVIFWPIVFPFAFIIYYILGQSNKITKNQTNIERIRDRILGDINKKDISSGNLSIAEQNDKGGLSIL